VKDDRGLRAVAILLASTAMLAALLAARAAFLSDAAADEWQTSLRTELKRSAAVLVDIRQVYGPEGDAGVMIVAEEMVAEELRAAVASAEPRIAESLAVHAQVHELTAENMSPGADIVADAYRLPDGSLDLDQRLADLRGEAPDLVALDPDAPAAAGDRSMAQARATIIASLPLGLAFLAGALAMPLGRRRRILLAAGWAAVAFSALAVIAMEMTT